MFSTAFFTALLLLNTASASAIPLKYTFNQLTRSLPTGTDVDAVAHIGIDETTGHYVAYKRDGSLFGRYVMDERERDVAATSNANADADANPAHGKVTAVGLGLNKRDGPGACSALTVEEAETLPGWNQLIDYANTNWGTGSRNILTNPSEYVSYPATSCVQGDSVQLSYTGSPVCQTNTVSTEGQLVGTSGEVMIDVWQGYSSDSSLTITKSATIGLKSVTTVSLSFPEVVDVSEAVTVEGKVTNTNSEGSTTSYNDIVKTQLKIDAPEGQTCTAVTSVKRCTLQATGDIRYYASGWVWFNYDSATNGHYKWAANIEGVISNPDDRSSTMTVKGSMDANTQFAYTGSCA